MSQMLDRPQKTENDDDEGNGDMKSRHVFPYEAKKWF